MAKSLQSQFPKGATEPRRRRCPNYLGYPPAPADADWPPDACPLLLNLCESRLAINGIKLIRPITTLEPQQLLAAQPFPAFFPAVFQHSSTRLPRQPDTLSLDLLGSIGITTSRNMKATHQLPNLSICLQNISFSLQKTPWWSGAVWYKQRSERLDDCRQLS